MPEPTAKARAWLLFDRIVADAAPGGDHSNPWHSVKGALEYRPDIDTLQRLLAVPLLLRATVRSGVPALALEYGRLTRDLKVHETLYALLISQYEQAKLAEARDTPTVQVLDPAIPAERKSRPKIALNVVIAGILSLLIGIFWAFLREALDRRRKVLLRPPTSPSSPDDALLSPLASPFESARLSQLETYENSRS